VPNQGRRVAARVKAGLLRILADPTQRPSRRHARLVRPSRKTERPRDRETERPRDRETEKEEISDGHQRSTQQKSSSGEWVGEKESGSNRETERPSDRERGN